MRTTIKKQLSLAAAAGLLLALTACNAAHNTPDMADYSYVAPSSGTSVYAPQQSMEDF